MNTQRHLKLTHDAGEDRISLPSDFALSSDEVVVRQDGDRLIVEPAARHRSADLLAWLATQAPLPPEDWPEPVSRAGEARPVDL